MKIQRNIMTALMAFFIMIHGFSALTAKADGLSPETAALQDNAPITGPVSSHTSEKEADNRKEETDIPADDTKEDADISSDETKKDADISSDETEKDADISSDETEKDADISSDETEKDADISSDETKKDADIPSDETTGPDASSAAGTSVLPDDGTEPANQSRPQENAASPDEETLPPDPDDAAGIPSLSPAMAAEETAIPSQGDAPAFTVYEQWGGQGCVLMGTFTEFAPDTSLVQPLYSLDGKNWHPCKDMVWNLYQLGTKEPDKLSTLQNQPCLYATREPLKNYLDGELDHFFLKLKITRENGDVYESQTAVIEREQPKEDSEEITATAQFASSMIIREYRPSYRNYGRYQLTVRESATPDDILALLPDTVPVAVQLHRGNEYIGESTIQCPITWKPLSLSRLAAGEHVTIADAAEEIRVPAGTLVHTVFDTFRLQESLRLDDNYGGTDQVMLILNVVPDDANPAGVLRNELNKLEMAFDLKPTGATDIQAYTLSKDKTKWISLPGLSLLKAADAYPSAAGSAYALVLNKTQEPYQSYLSAEAAGEEPEPFLIGLKIKGGVYDNRQLILPYPADYKLPPDLPPIGAGGNEANAGAVNKGDGTDDGQRPQLPYHPENIPTPMDSHEAEPEEAKSSSSPYVPGESAAPVQSPSPAAAANLPDLAAKESTSAAISADAVMQAEESAQPKESASAAVNATAPLQAEESAQPKESTSAAVNATAPLQAKESTQSEALPSDREAGAATQNLSPSFPLPTMAVIGVFGISIAVIGIHAAIAAGHAAPGGIITRLLNALRRFHS